jgi:hypothetical protein
MPLSLVGSLLSPISDHTFNFYSGMGSRKVTLPSLSFLFQVVLSSHQHQMNLAPFLESHVLHGTLQRFEVLNPLIGRQVFRAVVNRRASAS